VSANPAAIAGSETPANGKPHKLSEEALDFLEYVGLVWPSPGDCVAAATEIVLPNCYHPAELHKRSVKDRQIFLFVHGETAECVHAAQQQARRCQELGAERVWLYPLLELGSKYTTVAEWCQHRNLIQTLEIECRAKWVGATELKADAATDAARPVLVKITRGDQIVQKDVVWLWQDRVPLGMLTLFAGPPKIGKSLMTMGQAAAVSRGAPLPGGSIPRGPANVVIMSAEDDPSRTIVKRLKAAGADLARIHILESIIIPGDDSKPDSALPTIERLPCLASDVGRIEEAVAAIGDIALIIIDPISAYLSGIDDHRNVELRGVLSPLKAMAERLDCAIELVSHFAKTGGANGKNRVIGSIAYVGACRANFAFVRDPCDAKKILMCDNGCNLADTPPTLAFTIADRGDGPCVEWLDDPVETTIEEALAAQMKAEMQIKSGSDDSGARKEAASWLKEMLTNEPLEAKEISEAAKACMISWRTLERVKQDLGIKSHREGFGKDAKWFWRLPDECNDENVPF
jgi:hypothetical protein